jgi:hypothetical protein
VYRIYWRVFFGVTIATGQRDKLTYNELQPISQLIQQGTLEMG